MKESNITPLGVSSPKPPPDELYVSPYVVENGCLCLRRETDDDTVTIPLCNFAPRIIAELIIDDGADVTRKYLLGGNDENGNALPQIEVDATKLERMDWLHQHWDATCDLCVVAKVEKHVRHAIKSTAKNAEKRIIYRHTGWRKIGDEWHYLLPGNGQYDVQLHGKQQSYSTATTFSRQDLTCLAELFSATTIPHRVLFPALALVFLSPLNEFLRQVTHEPKFAFMLLGRTGSMKSTIAALMLSFFGQFSSTDLPMSFRDTANSIIHNAFALKDTLTCIDDYHPTGRRESVTMLEIMQAIARGYGDRATRNRLSSDIVLRDARPPRGNAIVTAEFAPDIGESGTARLFYIELKAGELDLPSLTKLQEQDTCPCPHSRHVDMLRTRVRVPHQFPPAA